MFKPGEAVLVIAGIVGLIAAGFLPRAAIAQKTDKSTPRQERSLALAEDEVRDLLLVMDTDKNGKISKQEFMKFMEAEFDRLDKDKSGELDPKELTQMHFRMNRPAIGK